MQTGTLALIRMQTRLSRMLEKVGGTEQTHEAICWGIGEEQREEAGQYTYLLEPCSG